MAENIEITSGSKAEKYQRLYPQIKALLEGENDLIANMANVCSALKYGMDFFWVGFYLVKNEELVLGPFQGPIACTRIAKGKGVCGKAWELNEVIVVDDVDQFPGHIACNALSKSEIVLPVRNAKGNITAILDVDSDAYNSFDGIDEEWLRKIVQLLS